MYAPQAKAMQKLKGLRQAKGTRGVGAELLTDRGWLSTAVMDGHGRLHSVVGLVRPGESSGHGCGGDEPSSQAEEGSVVQQLTGKKTLLEVQGPL